MNLPHTLTVVPQLPPELEPLREIAYNLWFSWNADAMALFQELDGALWEESYHSPPNLLQRVSQARLAEAAGDYGYVGRVQTVHGRLKAYLARPDRWFQQTYPDQHDALIAYFSAEYGVHESLQTYSGGLGILAGDHCKSASDLGLPFVAVGLMYRQGYFTQRLNKDGWQESQYINLDFNTMPLQVVTDGNGETVKSSVDLPGRKVWMRAWSASIGRIKIFFLDTDLPENREDDRRITYQLYGGDHEMRIKQEIVLGIGGKRFLLAAGMHPTIFHMNEGHAAFLALERIRRPVVEEGADFYSVLQTVAASSLFTTHTPVPAGNDAFSTELMERYFGEYAKELKISFDEFMKFGRPWMSKPDEPFSMTILALRLSRFNNGVSKIHGEVSRQMWQIVWPGVPVEEIPIGHITNGIHTQTWIAPEIKALVEKYTGDIWETNLSNPEAWTPVEQVPDAELWNTHCELKKKLVDFARNNVRSQRIRVQDSAVSIRESSKILDPNILTIGFARRFATYKRAGLLFRDPERLAKLLHHADRPIQFVFAGKSHPADDGGKKLIQAVYHASRRADFGNRVVFLENYDINVARHLYHGVDIWLNNPIRPLEASGTSGEKVCPNGAVNCSVLDGWWAEAWKRDQNGWAIGEGVTTPDSEVQNDFDADSLYSLLENVISPLYYYLEDGIPVRWLKYMKSSITTISPQYSTFRQVQDYTNNYYVPATKNGGRMMANGHASAAALAKWKERIRLAWPSVRVGGVNITPAPEKLTVGSSVQISAQVQLGSLDYNDVVVEAYLMTPDGRKTFIYPMHHQSGGNYVGTIDARDSGQYRFNVRVLPFHELLVQKHELRLTAWAE